MDNFLLTPTPIADFVKLLVENIVPAIREEIRQQLLSDQQEKFLSPAETCKLFKPAISKVTLSAWTKEGRLNDYRISGRVYYKYSEITEAVKHLSRYKKGGPHVI